MEPTNTTQPKVFTNFAPAIDTPTQPVAPTPTPAPTPVPPVAPTPVPPSMPPIPPKAPAEDHKEARVILPALLLVLIIAAGYYWYMNRTPAAPVVPAPAATSTQSAVVATSTPRVKPTSIPDGFPTSIPVEIANLTESYKLSYPDHGVTQYTISYTSEKTQAELWSLYNAYVSSQGYVINTKATNRAEGVLDADKGKNELNVVVSQQGKTSLAQVTYLERQ